MQQSFSVFGLFRAVNFQASLPDAAQFNCVTSLHCILGVQGLQQLEFVSNEEEKKLLFFQFYEQTVKFVLQHLSIQE